MMSKLLRRFATVSTMIFLSETNLAIADDLSLYNYYMWAQPIIAHHKQFIISTSFMPQVEGYQQRARAKTERLCFKKYLK